jgi:hypothetical protein
MRLAVMIAASVLVAGCSQGVEGTAQQSEPTLSVPPTSPTTMSAPVLTAAPAPGTPIASVIRWIEAGTAADVAKYHAATREGTTTQLGDDVAFTSPSGKTNCMTASRADGALACLVDLADAPPRPLEAYGEWKGGWVDFAGPTLEVGSVHGDPGRFSAGTGPALAYGHSLDFGDYRCRADPAGVFCVNYAHQSAARFSETGIVAFGCLKQVTPPADVGLKFSC